MKSKVEIKLEEFKALVPDFDRVLFRLKDEKENEMFSELIRAYIQPMECLSAAS